MPPEYDFAEQLALSKQPRLLALVSQILLAKIPGAVKVYEADPANDKQGVDYWVELSTARHLAVDLKAQSKDYDTLPLETWSVKERQVVGWTRNAHKHTDYILWIWLDTGRFCLIPFPMLCQVFELNLGPWQEKYRVATQYTPANPTGGDYHSECVFVPWPVVWREIVREYGQGALPPGTPSTRARGEEPVNLPGPPANTAPGEGDTGTPATPDLAGRFPPGESG